MNGIRKEKPAVALLVAAVTFAVFLPTLRNGFVNWDDGPYVYENSFIRSLDTKFLESAFLEFHASNWHPLAWISHALDYSLWGMNPLGHHLTNNLLHAANAFLVTYLVISILATTGKRTAEDRPPETFAHHRAGLVAGAATGLLFGVHPLHVESVAWVSERKDLLCALFFLLAITMYARFAENADGDSRRYASGSRFFDRYYLLALGFFLLALSSKPMAVSLPLVLLILDWHPFARIRSLETFRMSFVEKMPFFALSLASSAVTLLAQRSGEAITPVEILPPSTRAIVAAQSVVTYLWKMAVPLNLVPFYPYPTDVSLLSLKYFLPPALIMGITIICVVRSQKEKLWASLWFYYLATLIPVLGFVQVGLQSMADRYTYLPSIAPFLLVGLSSGRIYERLAAGILRGPMPKIAAGFVAVSVLVSLSYVTGRQILVWKNGLVFWNYVIERQPGKVPVAYSNLAEAYMSDGQPQMAIQQYQMALRLKPDDAKAYNNLGAAYLSIGQPGKALDHIRMALTLKPDYPDALYNLGNLYASNGQPGLAIQQYQAASRLKPDDSKIYHNLAVAYALNGQPDLAIEQYRRALSLTPDDTEAHYNLGSAYMAIGSADMAIQEYRTVLRLRPNSAGAYFNVGLIYLRAGRSDLARREFESGLRLEPTNDRARELLDSLQGNRGPEK